MKTIGNIIWLLFAGIELFLMYAAVGLLACITIVGIPIGVACFRMASYVIWPFGRTVIAKPGVKPFSAVGNVIWFILAGVWLALGHITTAVIQAITIIGIPLAIANIKLIPVTCFPFGKDIVDSRMAPALSYQRAYGVPPQGYYR